jgi:hypothetical protein
MNEKTDAADECVSVSRAAKILGVCVRTVRQVEKWQKMRDAGFEPAPCRRGDRSTVKLSAKFRARGEDMRDRGFEPLTSCV